MGGLIIPKTYLEKLDAPLIFLAGPIACAPLWQDEAAKFILSQEPLLFVASPQRGVRDAIKPYVLESTADYEHFSRQRAWERHYLQIAAKAGALMFWLPNPARHDCDVVYGATTRLELGQWLTNYRLDRSTRLCIGTDGKFPAWDIIKYDVLLDAPDLNVKNALEDVCQEAIRLASDR